MFILFLRYFFPFVNYIWNMLTHFHKSLNY